jgi:hypothetical protein
MPGGRSYNHLIEDGELLTTDSVPAFLFGADGRRSDHEHSQTLSRATWCTRSGYVCYSFRIWILERQKVFERTATSYFNGDRMCCWFMDHCACLHVARLRSLSGQVICRQHYSNIKDHSTCSFANRDCVCNAWTDARLKTNDSS